MVVTLVTRPGTFAEGSGLRRIVKVANVWHSDLYCLTMFIHDYTSIVGVYIYRIHFSNLRGDRTCSYQRDHVCLGLELSCSMYDTKITSTIMYRTVGTNVNACPFWKPQDA